MRVKSKVNPLISHEITAIGFPPIIIINKPVMIPIMDAVPCLSVRMIDERNMIVQSMASIVMWPRLIGPLGRYLFKDATATFRAERMAMRVKFLALSFIVTPISIFVLTVYMCY